MTTRTNILMRSRLVTAITCAFAARGFKHGMKIDVPGLNAFQLMSYLIPSTSIGFDLFRFRNDFAHIKEAAR